MVYNSKQGLILIAKRKDKFNIYNIFMWNFKLGLLINKIDFKIVSDSGLCLWNEGVIWNRSLP